MYRVALLPSAARSLGRLPRDDIRRLAEDIDRLQSNPRPSGVVKLTSMDNKYRIRVGNYRVLYIVEDDILSITVVAIGHRRDVYR